MLNGFDPDIWKRARTKEEILDAGDTVLAVFWDANFNYIEQYLEHVHDAAHTLQNQFNIVGVTDVKLGQFGFGIKHSPTAMLLKDGYAIDRHKVESKEAVAAWLKATLAKPATASIIELSAHRTDPGYRFSYETPAPVVSMVKRRKAAMAKGLNNHADMPKPNVLSGLALA